MDSMWVYGFWFWGSKSAWLSVYSHGVFSLSLAVSSKYCLFKFAQNHQIYNLNFFFLIRISISSLLRHCFIIYWDFHIETHITKTHLYVYIFFCFASLCCVLWSYALHNNSFETYWVPFKCHSLYFIMNYNGTNSGGQKCYRLQFCAMEIMVV